jgi:hypothetical protein
MTLILDTGDRVIGFRLTFYIYVKPHCGGGRSLGELPLHAPHLASKAVFRNETLTRSGISKKILT